MSRRTGKIAQLPWKVRAELNRRLRDGDRYGEIAGWLETVGIEGISEKNVENWCKGDGEGSSGYLDWLNEQGRLDEMKRKREFALQVFRENEGSSIHEAALHVAASQLYEVITDFDLERLKSRLADKPGEYSDLVAALARLSKGGLEFAKYRDRVADQKRKIEDVARAAKREGGLTEESLQKIEEAAALL